MRVSKKKITVKDVRNSYVASAMIGFPASARWFGRPVADVLTPFLFNLGFTANLVTVLRILLYFGSIALLFFHGYPVVFIAAIGLLISFVLDFVDGHLARLRDNASYFGKFFDGFGDYLFPVFLTLPVAYRAWVETGEMILFSASLFCAGLILMSRLARERLRFFLSLLPKEIQTLNTKNARIKTYGKFESFLSKQAANTRVICIFILFIPNAEMLYLLAMLSCQIVIELAWFCAILASSYSSLNHWRKSVSAP